MSPRKHAPALVTAAALARGLAGTIGFATTGAAAERTCSNESVEGQYVLANKGRQIDFLETDEGSVFSGTATRQ